MRASRESFAVELEDHTKAAKRLHTKIYWARKKAQRVPACGAFLEVAAKVDAEATRVIGQLEAFRRDSTHILGELHAYQGFLARVMETKLARPQASNEAPRRRGPAGIFNGLLHSAA